MDTATLNSNFSNTEVTLDSVEVVDDEEDETYSGQYTILNMTVKNIGDEPVDFRDIFETTQLVAGEEDGGTMWDFYADFTDDWPEDIEVGKEVSGPLVYDVEERIRSSNRLWLNLCS